MFTDWILFRAVVVSQQDLREGAGISQIAPWPHTWTVFHIIPPEWYFCFDWWAYSDTALLPKVHSLHCSSFLVLSILCLSKCLITCIHRYRVIQSISLHWKSWDRSIHLHSSNLSNHWYVYCLHSFPTARMSHSCNTVCSFFSHWLRSLSNMHLRFLHVFHGWQLISCLDVTPFIYPFTCWGIA